MTEKKRNQNSFLLMLHGGVINQNIPECLDDLIAIQEKLFDFGLTLSGFQFVGLIFENSIKNLETHFKVAYFILSLGFVFSLFGSLLSYIVFKYLRSIKNETQEFIIHGVNKYHKLFLLSYIVPFSNSILFMIPLNILIYNILESYYGIIFNVVSSILFILGVIFHHIVIVNKQEYKIKKLKSIENQNSIELHKISRRFSSYVENQIQNPIIDDDKLTN